MPLKTKNIRTKNQGYNKKKKFKIFNFNYNND